MNALEKERKLATTKNRKEIYDFDGGERDKGDFDVCFLETQYNTAEAFPVDTNRRFQHSSLISFPPEIISRDIL